MTEKKEEEINNKKERKEEQRNTEKETNSKRERKEEQRNTEEQTISKRERKKNKESQKRKQTELSASESESVVDDSDCDPDFCPQSSDSSEKMLSFPVNSKNRKEQLTLLRKKGNYLNNNDKIKPMRDTNSNSNYLPCIHCVGYYSSKNLWRHRKYCSENPEAGKSTAGSTSSAQNFLVRHLKIDSQLQTQVFPHMRADKISLTAKKDPLICAFAARYIKIHREKHFISVASRKMREIGKLLIEMKKLQPSIKTLFDALQPQHYDLLVTATKDVAKYNRDKDFYESPTYAINMGTTLKQCCEIALMYAMKKENIHFVVPLAEAEVHLKTMIQLIEAHWKFDISSQACNDLNMKKWNKVTLVPLASDLKLFKEYLIKTANSAVMLLEKNDKDQNAYAQLTETIFCRVILLNRKRPGELQRLLLRIYELSLENENDQSYEEFSEVGKRGRGVPVLFSKDIQDHLNILLKYRHKVMKKPNPYLFGNPNSDQPIIGYKILKKHANLSGVQNPNAITCTRLRKHLATLTQLFNMSENDMEQLATFMGHTLGIHRSSYRLPDDVYQTAKISKLLILMEKGQAGEFKGKSLDDINLNMEEDLLENTEKANTQMDENFAIDDIGNECPNTIESNEDQINTTENVTSAQTNSKQKKRVLIPWTEEQKKVVCSFFKGHIKAKKPPKRSECETLIEMNPELLNNKNWLKIKVFIQNKYTKK
ncbi:hypothetical protein MML48_4g00000646 [Holotrichia oblita]|uniref:Uncharacterized protein n=1 Tax=Holotrichia oblita TaxID=644536 RepID=A0ACB9T8U9_HOLOL|nr:hypothetical protein MML48_4g00000646 [Holotrichia oblita]